ncbi:MULTISPECIES: hypothetical protein [unclassified Mesorhizobium]|uniref:hypothetical protein n=1 Tax=unclassified Mesorhizobium TaxID=325217 RepID=UPI00112A0E9F|nr:MULTISPECIES: hypothetical protein [unclassified Mesorhizobium]TPK99039.1 hypothetical protein FJ567_17325 [Mesorhizobium sp. B2-4-16]TPL59475.1 hypothetical protein FJ956_28575 [Mesorhizobium sp. B2-4-3]
MYKSRSKSMQRGADYHSNRSGPHEPIPPIVPIMREQEKLHFGIGDDGIAAFVEKLRPTVIGLARGGYRKPRDVARLLNQASIKTFAGHNWNPRLASFLLSFMFDEKYAKKKPSVAKTSPAASRPHPNRHSMPRAPLSKSEVERRAAALRKAVDTPAKRS